MAEITKISSKGQVVIPSKIREELDLEEGTRLVVTRIDNLVLLKKIQMENLQEEFKRLTKRGEKFAKEKSITKEEDVIKKIHQRRKTKSD